MHSVRIITLKKSVHDPQGDAVARCCRTVRGVRGIRIGKLVISKSKPNPRGLHRCGRQDVQRLLVNGELEAYKIQLAGAGAAEMKYGVIAPQAAARRNAQPP